VEKKRAYELVQEPPDDRLAWVVRVDGTDVGAVRIDTEATDYLEAPAVHVTITDEKHQDGKLMSLVVKDMISYAYRNLPYERLFARNLAADKTEAKTWTKLGFEADDKPYTDDDGSVWQNTVLVI
jgi:hypothetical protein